MTGKYPYVIDTLGKHIDEGYIVTVHCHAQFPGGACGHQGKLDLEVLAKKLGRDFRFSYWTIAPMLRCSKCGARGRAVANGPISIICGNNFKHARQQADYWAKPPAE